ncbi:MULTISPECIES: TAXI family TRAP transporter solute-binding subunit [unclassified Thioalkalivibrio]|uniref:TAXI family TRAP transporter solute-binding subunit n=1 Tax=unclassified Thioalkalivibrio TaxID=2621013 RepID=UPI000366D153|nr:MULTISPECIES: TAXI family TRAP transporter solute-binding subunit [unclassified Thioalkalivibrio]
MNRSSVPRADRRWLQRLLPVLTLVSLLLATTAQAESRFINIGTGGVTGVYYPAGQHLCRLFNTRRDEHGMRCTAESTGGSVFNLNMIRSGDMDFGVAQSDLQYHAYRGSGRFEEFGPAPHLRAAFSLHAEPLTLVVRPDADIEGLDDLPGKRVNIGNPGSGQRILMEELMGALGWDQDTFRRVSELPSREQAQALCDNRIDAFVFSVGHPSAAIQEPIATCNARLVSIEGSTVDQLVEDTPYYLRALIPAGTYPGQDDDIHTYGVGATLVTSTRTSERAVYEITRAVFENFETFRGLHPAFGPLERETMVDEGLSAPLHPGAQRYFREAGLIE